MSRIGSTDFMLEVAKGNVVGHSQMNKYGHNPEVTTATDPEDVWSGGGLYEFYFITTARLYGLLTPTGFNVILQNNAKATDDGSLSVYFGQRNIEYVNIEAQHGHKSDPGTCVRKHGRRAI